MTDPVNVASAASAMTDGQLGAIVLAITGGLGAIAAAVRFGITRVVRSNDAGTAALIANTASNAVLTVKVEDMCRKLDGISDWMEQATPIGAIPTPRAPRRGNTPARGAPIGSVGLYGISRQRTRGEDDE